MRGNKLISIDDAYKNPLIVEIWENIESQIYKKILYYILN